MDSKINDIKIRIARLQLQLSDINNQLAVIYDELISLDTEHKQDYAEFALDESIMNEVDSEQISDCNDYASDTMSEIIDDEHSVSEVTEFVPDVVSESEDKEQWNFSTPFPDTEEMSNIMDEEIQADEYGVQKNGEISMPEVEPEGIERCCIGDLRRAFTLNDRYRFRRELFGNNDSEMVDTLNVLSAMHDLHDVEDYVYNDLQWDSENDEVKEFMEIIRQRYH